MMLALCGQSLCAYPTGFLVFDFLVVVDFLPTLHRFLPRQCGGKLQTGDRWGHSEGEPMQSVWDKVHT